MSRVFRRSTSVAGVVLAAGESKRFGPEPKQLAEIDGEQLLRRAVRAVLGAELAQVVLVLGHQYQKIAKVCADLEASEPRLTVLNNPDYRAGQSTSVRTGLAQVEEGAEAAIFVPADQPYLSPRLIDQLITKWRQGAKIVVSQAGERRGAPVLFSRKFFPELAELRGDRGGRALLPRYAHEVEAVEVLNPQELVDVDTLEDLQALQALH